MKEELKQKKAEQQNGLSIDGSVLPKDTSLYDTHRLVPRAKGGKYTDKNYVVLTPREHMVLHGIWRDHGEFEELKSLWDDFKKVQQVRVSMNNQLKAFKRGTDILAPDTAEFLKGQVDALVGQEKDRNKALDVWLKGRKDNPFIQSILSVKFIGPVTAGAALNYIDISKARYPSSLWKYVGYAGPSAGRYIKGEASGGNETLRSALYVFSANYVKGERFGSPYCEVYRQAKLKYENSKNLVDHRYVKKTHRVMWCSNDVPGMAGHRDAAARRKANKCFLADLWFVWRTLAGLPTADLYVKEHLGHERATINPRERGWVY